MQALLGDAQLTHRHQHGGYGFLQLVRAYLARLRAMLHRGEFDVLWIEKEALPWLPLWLESWLLRGVPYVLDYDDAIFHSYDLHSRPWVRRIYGRRLDGLMAGAALVVGGNNYLAQRAREAGTRRVEMLPTVIDLLRYPISDTATSEVNSRGSESLCIVWIGSPTTAHYLQLLSEPLRLLAEKISFTLRVIGGGQVSLPGVKVESVVWTEATEVASIQSGDVGVMPLLDSPWERGKCGYKLIQYMACSLPVVASAVGVNSEIVEHGTNGFLASTSDEWVVALEKLLRNADLRRRMGQDGRRRVEKYYCSQQTAPRLVALLLSVAESGG